MSTQEKMFAAVERWLQSGQEKKEFLQGQDFSESKFNYWVSKWKRDQHKQEATFEPIKWESAKAEKVLEIVTHSGMKITIFG
jgi:hypothetical protein